VALAIAGAFCWWGERLHAHTKGENYLQPIKKKHKVDNYKFKAK
jgi:hypothetical protein